MANNVSKRILIVEDDGIIAGGLQRVLTQLGYTVLGAVASGEAAIPEAAETCPDLVLMDIHLAGELDGIETATRIQADQDLAVVYLTAYSDDALLQQAKTTAPYGYVVKPVQGRELYATIEIALHRHELERRLKQRNQELLALQSVSAVVNRSLDLEEILDAGLDEVLQLTCLDVGGIQLLDETGEWLLLAAHRGISETFCQAVAEVRLADDPWANLAFASGQPQVVEDRTHAPERIKAEANAEGLGSFVQVPLHAAGRMLGLMTVQSREQRSFSTEEVSLLAAIGDTLGLAIENAHLYRDLQRQMDTLKRTQTQLIHSDRLAIVGRLAAGVAHELNNPLTSVLGFAEVLLDELGSDSPHREDLATIVSQARRARDIVRRLLNFARQTEARREPADLNQILRETLDVIRYHLEKEGVVIEEDYAGDIGFLSLDEGQLKQVLLNLISNAAQAMPDGGRLSLRTARIGDEVALSIADTGMGISPEDQANIFDPFFSTRPSAPGLGLSVSMGIVQEHGGRITVESQEGQGSTFTIFLPLV